MVHTWGDSPVTCPMAVLCMIGVMRLWCVVHTLRWSCSRTCPLAQGCFDRGHRGNRGVRGV